MCLKMATNALCVGSCTCRELQPDMAKPVSSRKLVTLASIAPRALRMRSRLSLSAAPGAAAPGASDARPMVERLWLGVPRDSPARASEARAPSARRCAPSAGGAAMLERRTASDGRAARRPAPATGAAVDTLPARAPPDALRLVSMDASVMRRPFGWDMANGKTERVGPRPTRAPHAPRADAWSRDGPGGRLCMHHGEERQPR